MPSTHIAWTASTRCCHGGEDEFGMRSRLISVGKLLEAFAKLAWAHRRVDLG
jgi:hypothetical protein